MIWRRDSINEFHFNAFGLRDLDAVEQFCDILKNTGICFAVFEGIVHPHPEINVVFLVFEFDVVDAGDVDAEADSVFGGLSWLSQQKAGNDQEW